MASFDMEGKVKVIMDEQTFDSGFNKREFVVTTDEQYPQDIKFECVKDKCSLLNDISVGQTIKVGFNLRGNEYKERYYVNLQAWRIEAGDSKPSFDPAAVDEAADIQFGDPGENPPF